ncbi:Na(+)-translocating NADH-quinone reductase subunit C [Neptunomonas phycophila]|jgi:Na+-transporting NADH:ubiquinone oxidoreductase subunit C|uniref:Na(+)-translocating NADH-quinone reductase subunit C n=1 Tax=Neptunomonas phycophila TaxID=1572645 RepID=A0AAW7XDN8_9GAMM|nr:Na(+)-translocating NADH-quinone reductase subunit C [Neptunomonas phycophila]MDO6452105.1 Na(+)-translocating NADH-quinone reductase subunit C [Neptunomonas phycophila]QLE97967.1 Na(+)-translocating NADH-quinone reductase subunit C [Neptunomonas phycophila]
MSANKDSIGRTILVTVLLCVVCSVVVSAAAVLLKPQQVANKELDRKTNILAAAGLLDPSKSVDELFSQITTKIVDIETGKFSDAVDAETYDARKASKDPEMSRALSREEDIASIKREARYQTVYLVEKEGQLDSIILPVHGYGLWSTLYGFLALEGDLNTVVGLGFYSHAETPGLGGEVDNPQWKALWPGKKIYEEGSWSPEIRLIKGNVDPTSSSAPYQIDGLSGATLTSNGVTHLVQFWMGENGYAPFLKNLKAGEA